MADTREFYKAVAGIDWSIWPASANLTALKEIIEQALEIASDYDRVSQNITPFQMQINAFAQLQEINERIQKQNDDQIERLSGIFANMRLRKAEERVIVDHATKNIESGSNATI